MNPDIQERILNKLDSIDSKLSHFGNRITTLEVKTDPLFDNGQEGSITKLDNRLKELEQVRWRSAGFFAVFLLVIEVIGHVLWDKVLLGR